MWFENSHHTIQIFGIDISLPQADIGTFEFILGNSDSECQHHMNVETESKTWLKRFRDITVQFVLESIFCKQIPYRTYFDLAGLQTEEQSLAHFNYMKLQVRNLKI